MEKRILGILIFLLTPLVIYLGVSLFYRVTIDRADGIPSMKVSVERYSPPAERQPEPFSSYQAITTRNLFKASAERNGASSLNPAPVLDGLKETDLKLRLWGTVTGEGGVPYAVIEEKQNRKQQLYKIDDTVQNAVVRLILRDKIVLRVNGKNEILEMEKSEIDQNRSSSSEPSFQSTSASDGSVQSIRLSRSMIEDSMNNLNTLMDQVKVRPHFQGGKPDGLMLKSIKSNSVFEKLGLRNNDIIKGVDGQDIQTVDDALKLVNNLREADNIRLQIQRQGTMRTIDCTIQ